MLVFTFALHGNVRDDSVWEVIPTAEKHGFSVERLPSHQLTPQIENMAMKRGLVHVLRLVLQK